MTAVEVVSSEEDFSVPDFVSTLSKVLSRRSTLLSMIAVVAALSGSEARAGLILPWAHEDAPAAVDFVSEGASSTSTTSLPIPREAERREKERDSNGVNCADGLADTAGGASSPTSSTSGPSTSAPAALFAVPAVVPAIHSYGALRERAPQLPQASPGELLDPPKACA